MSTQQKRRYNEFTDSERYEIVQEYLRGGVTKQGLWHKHSGNRLEHGQILQMLRQFGYAPIEGEPRSRSRSLEVRMKKESTSSQQNLLSVVRNRYVEDLERELAETKLQLLMLKTLVEVAEEELGIDLKKTLASRGPQDEAATSGVES